MVGEGFEEDCILWIKYVTMKSLVDISKDRDWMRNMHEKIGVNNGANEDVLELVWRLRML